MRKRESLEEAVKREVLEETGLQVRVLRQVGVINQIFLECHTVSIYYLVEPANLAVTLNSEHSGYRWVSRLPRGTHCYLRTMIEKAGLPS